MGTTIKDLRGKPLTVLMAIISEYPRLPTVKRLAEITGYSRERIPAALQELDRHGLIKRYHRSAWTLIHSPDQVVNSLCEGDKMSHSMLQNVTLSDSEEENISAQSDKMSHSMLQNVTLSEHDDHDDDEELIYSLASLGFSDARYFIKKHDQTLISSWINWESTLSTRDRDQYKNIGGYIRKAIKRGERPIITAADPIRRRIPADLLDIIVR